MYTLDEMMNTMMSDEGGGGSGLHWLNELLFEINLVKYKAKASDGYRGSED